MLGTMGIIGRGGDERTIFQWLTMSGASRRKPGRGRAWV